MAHISTRKFIKWGEKPASENTDTLVLTTASCNFVDIRIYLHTTPSQPSLPSLTPLPLSRLEWGFAGTSSPTPATYSALPGKENEVERPAHTVWSHWVDSRTSEEVKDEGDMWKMENGEVMERGVMVNPDSGEMEIYEECWVDLAIGKVDGDVGGDGEGEFRSWVLRIENGEGTVRGVIARVGIYIQGVMRRDEEFSVGRWMWDGEKGWQPVVEVGKAFIPRGGVFSQENFVLGQKMAGGGGLEWVCVESFSWK